MVVGELAQEKDVVIIGGGPAGYTAAIRAAQSGREVLLIEKEQLGGTCLNKGCIPSKTTAEAAKQHKQLDHLKNMGFEIGSCHFQFDRFKEYRDAKVDQLRKGVEALCKVNKIEVMFGEAVFLSDDRIGIENGHQFDVVRFNHALITVGASSGKKAGVIGASDLFRFSTLPEEMILAGSSYIVLEAAFAYQSFGVKTAIINEDESFGLDETIEKELLRQLKKAKIPVHMGAKEIKIDWNGDRTLCRFVNAKGESMELASSHIYMDEKYTGNTSALGLDRIGIKLDENQFIKVDEWGRTSLSNIFAAGDVTGAPFSAVKAIKQGKAAVEAMMGNEHAAPADFYYLPRIIHSQPPIASVGMTEEEARCERLDYRAGTYVLGGNGYAALTEKKDGLVKVLFEEGTDRLLGIHIIGEGAIDLIQTGILGLEMAAREEDFFYPNYAHPSLAESLLEACEDAVGKAIHQAPKIKKEKVKM
ncbi:dihydrolipoyl dehydrogenase family protein [Falsibacillus pallidus]|uniref:dihydrolipoyl dehydrogenase family protein n=1 Tax=Falsibacillus pallidus TaxID=493781 RepID=UPI003D996382